MSQRVYGWKRGLPSRRFPQLALTSFPVLSPSKSLVATGFFPPIWDQGQTGSCTGHGVARAIAFARAKQGLPFFDPSRLFPYWNARVQEGGQTQDGGAAIGDVVQAVQTFGDCPYVDLPTDPKLVTVAPSGKAFDDSITHKAMSVTRVMASTAAGLQYHTKHCIDVLGLPVVVGIVVYESFESDAVAKSGIIPMPGVNETQLGGHCVLNVGYDDPSEMALCANSWSEDWGIQGYFKIPYAYLFNAGFADDFHAIQLVA
jgi:hypothetical protein